MNILRFANPLIQTRQQYDMILFIDDVIDQRVNVSFDLTDTQDDIKTFGINYIANIYPNEDKPDFVLDNIIIDTIEDGNI
jgi:hypothetical protein